MKNFLSLYSSTYPETIVYMLQNTEYQPRAYLRWYWRASDFTKIMYRRRLDKTKPARLLLTALITGMTVQLLLGITLIIVTYGNVNWWTFLGWVLVLTYPVIWAHLIVVPLIIGQLLIIDPKNRSLIKESKSIFAKHTGIKIAVAGSYGKTSMKELLNTVLGEGKVIAVTPANKNVSSSHARFAKKLTGKEEVLVIEYGEGAPGDVKKYTAITKPTFGVITGLAPAHLDRYPSLAAAGQDIFSLARSLKPDHIYVNTESEATKAFMKPGFHGYNSHSVLGWKIQDIKVDFNGTSFVMKKGREQLKLKSGLLGRHQVGPLAFAAAFGIQLGLTKSQVEAGVAKTHAFEHRMQPRSLHGAWILDDTYNGNIDGMIAGLQLLHELSGKRKIYVTPGLVDQGEETERVHNQLGEEIARANPNKVILMKNSTTDAIQAGLRAGGYKGEVQIESNPLEFYTNLEHFIASGDVIMMQNDWPDNYN